MQRDDDDRADWRQEQESGEENYLRFRIAEIASQIARFGGKQADELERELLAQAGLSYIPPRDDAQPELPFNLAA